MTKRIIGIVGGMGSQATVDIFDRMVKSTPASKDQDHLQIIINCNPSIPDRTLAIIAGGDSPLPSLLKAVDDLHKWGAEIIVLACNTAHFYYEDIYSTCKCEMVNMITESVKAVGVTGAKRVGVLATDGTLATKLYQNAISTGEMDVLVPLKDEQSVIMDAIYGPFGIKSGYLTQENKNSLYQISHKLISRGADALIMACTEIPLLINEADFKIPIVLSNQILADTTVRIAMQQAR